MTASRMLEVLALLLALLAFGGVAWHLRSQRKSVSDARSRNAEWLGASPAFDVAYLVRSDLERPEFAMRAAQPGVLALSRETIRFAGVAPLSRVDVRLEFEPATARVAYFHGPWHSLGLRSLVRISGPSGSHYFYARSLIGQADEAKTRALHEALRARLRPESGAASEPKGSSALGYVAVAVFLALVVGAVLSVTLMRPDGGPWALATHATGGAAAATERALLRFGPDGKLAWRRPYQELGFANAPLSVAFDAAGTLHAGDPKTGRLYRCGDGDGATCTPLAELPAEVRPDGAFKLAFAPDGRIVLGDTEQDRLLLLDATGRLLARVERAASGLCFPNGLAFGGDGHLYVADTNNFRVARFALEGDTLRYVSERLVVADRHGAPGAECSGSRVGRAVPRGSAEPLPGARRQRVWPVALAQAADGHWFVTLATERLRRADVAEFDADWQPVAVRSLGDSNDPVQLAAWHDELWIADTQGPGIRRVRAGFVPVEAGDEALSQLFERMSRAQSQGRVMRVAAPLAIMLPLLLTVVAALLATRRRVARILRGEPAPAGR